MTEVVIENGYSLPAKAVVYRAFWQAVRFDAPLAPGDASDPQATVPASANTAYALLAPGFDPGSSAQPASVIVVESRSGFAVDLGSTLHITIDDVSFAGNCATGSVLTQGQADFVMQRVFASEMDGRAYDAATCTTRGAP